MEELLPPPDTRRSQTSVGVPIPARRFHSERKRRGFASRILVMVVAAAIALPGQAQNLISSTFDRDVAGWAVKAGQAEISWDGMNGYPAPGSLRFSAESDSVFEAVSPCIKTVDNEILTAAGRVLEPEGMPPGVKCFITITLYADAAGCTGSRTITGNVPPNNRGVWEESGFIFDVRTYPSVEVALTLVVNTSAVGEKYCLFDSVTLASDSRAPSIPALSGSGVLVLCLVLSVCGVAAMSFPRHGVRKWQRREKGM